MESLEEEKGTGLYEKDGVLWRKQRPSHVNISLNVLGVGHVRSSAYHPESQGTIER